jgi:DNA-binding beta-propeller fold protein YncE
VKKSSISLLLALLVTIPMAIAQHAEPLQLVQTIPLDKVEGRIDHFSVDGEGQRLFISALGNNTVEVIDLRAAKQAHSIEGMNEPQGVSYANNVGKIFIANAKDGSLHILDAKSYGSQATVNYSDDADNLRYDSAEKRLYVGYGDGALGILDASTDKRVGDIKLDAHPESFQLEKSGPRIYVNVTNAQHIAVIDRKQQAVIAKWPLEDARANFPMALDEADHRLFVTCRRPAELLVFDTTSGKRVANLPVVGDADDMFYDAAQRRIYISGGEGFISVVAQRDPDHYEVIAKIPTAAGARTSFFDAAHGRLYLAVPHRGAQKAEVRVYQTGK